MWDLMEHRYLLQTASSAHSCCISASALLTQKTHINLLSLQACTRWWVASCLQWVTAMKSKAWYWLSTALLWQSWRCRAPTGSPLMNGKASRQTGRRQWSQWGMKQVCVQSQSVLITPLCKVKSYTTLCCYNLSLIFTSAVMPVAQNNCNL